MSQNITLLFIFFSQPLKSVKTILHRWAHRKQWVAGFGLPAMVVFCKTRTWFENGEVGLRMCFENGDVPHTFEGGVL